MKLFLAVLLLPLISSAAVDAKFDLPDGSLHLIISDPEAATLFSTLKMQATNNPDYSKTKSFTMTYLNVPVMDIVCTQLRQTSCEMNIYRGSGMTSVNPGHHVAEVAVHDHDWLSKFILPQFRLKPFVPISTWEQRSEILVSDDKKLRLWIALTNLEGSRKNLISFHLHYNVPVK